ncbi:zinc ABC transporter substrate-binding protein [Arcanobacterium phocisimile]|uniref:Zinc ABC transporter substrate-binding protein n=1 Tax=Arcanobacterium phocisimile TaxID=1302235 RepID=A0ABX7IK28_9ACTO|nr:metal ABC transporter substrate-binding protein [Arcanobacterium phocisimile]QRV02789.1 zinc ABC transporter substrate-binding protein [Arcanobacterium phocisimile]
MTQNNFRVSTLAKFIALTSASALALIGCSTDASEKATTADGKISVTTSFYPLTYLVSEVGGEHVSITDLTPPGADAHGVELSPKEISDMQKSDIVFYLAKLSPAIDDAVASADANAINIGESVHLLTNEETGGEAHHHEHESDADHDEHADHDHEADHDEHADHDHDHEADHDEHADHDHDHEADHDEHADHDHEGHDHGIYDPHFWTDPERMAEAADAIATTLSEKDPANAEDYKANTKALITKLTDLDQKFDTAFSATCETKSFVVTHAAFGYLAHEYGLKQIGVAGIDPEFEPSPARIAEIKKLVETEKINTIFTPTNGEEKVAQTVAKETGAQFAVLDVAATRGEDSADYISIMEKNLQSLTNSMRCVK